MSLNGNLEDLPLLDIIQIVSFSKKTGCLAIRTGDGDGGIVFRRRLRGCRLRARKGGRSIRALRRPRRRAAGRVIRPASRWPWRSSSACAKAISASLSPRCLPAVGGRDVPESAEPASTPRSCSSTSRAAWTRIGAIRRRLEASFAEPPRTEPPLAADQAPRGGDPPLGVPRHPPRRPCTCRRASTPPGNARSGRARPARAVRAPRGKGRPPPPVPAGAGDHAARGRRGRRPESSAGSSPRAAIGGGGLGSRVGGEERTQAGPRRRRSCS